MYVGRLGVMALEVGEETTTLDNWNELAHLLT